MEMRTATFTVAMAGLVLMLADFFLPRVVGVIGAVVVVGAIAAEFVLRRADRRADRT